MLGLPMLNIPNDQLSNDQTGLRNSIPKEDVDNVDDASSSGMANITPTSLILSNYRAMQRVVLCTEMHERYGVPVKGSFFETLPKRK